MLAGRLVAGLSETIQLLEVILGIKLPSSSTSQSKKSPEKLSNLFKVTQHDWQNTTPHSFQSITQPPVRLTAGGALRALDRRWPAHDLQRVGVGSSPRYPSPTRDSSDQ